MVSASARLYWLGFAVEAKRVLGLRGHSASVLARLVEADGKPVSAARFYPLARYRGEPMKPSCIKPAVHFVREALADCGLAACVVTERGARGEGVSFYRLDGAALVRAFIEGPQ